MDTSSALPTNTSSALPITMIDINSQTFKSNYIAFQNLLNSDIAKYKSLLATNLKLNNGFLALTWFMGGAATIITFIQSVSSSIVNSAQQQNISSQILLSQFQFMQETIICNYVELSLIISTMGISKLNSYFSSQINKYNLHIIKAREYINLIYTDFSSAYSNATITSDQMVSMNTLNQNYNNEQLAITENNTYATTNSTVAVPTASTACNIV